jgi:hypothetical protein
MTILRETLNAIGLIGFMVGAFLLSEVLHAMS